MMKRVNRFVVCMVALAVLLVLVNGPCHAQVLPGQMAPVFSLPDVNGTPHDLATMKGEAMVVLYFFDAASRPSQEGFISLGQLTEKYADADLTVWGITVSPRNQVGRFFSEANPRFPVLIDNTGVSDLYNARFVLPTVCILGPGLSVMDLLQGGGKTTEIMLTRLAERTLQRKKTLLAKAMTEKVTATNPENHKARSLKGYAALEEGDYNEAQATFESLSKKGGEGELLGKEGLVAVYAKTGKNKEALALASEVEEKAPERGYVHKVKGDILYSQNDKQAAQREYEKAVQGKKGTAFQKATALNQLGRFHATLGKYDKARALYDQAIEIDPYYIEATSNKGMTFEKEGNWNDALSTYRSALRLNKNDTFASVLAQKAQEMLSLQENKSRKDRIDTLVKDLAERYRKQKKSYFKSKDTWTSRPMVLTFVDFQEKGGLSERDGFSTVLTSQLAEQLNASGRVQVVERILMERLLEELNIGSSELANPETALQLGRVLAAKVVGTGSLLFVPDQTLLTLRLIDTETSAIPKVFTSQISSGKAFDKELHRLNREVLKTIIQKYPLRGFVVQVNGDQVMINLGTKQGVVAGTTFDVVEEQKPITYKGKLLHSAPKAIGQVEIVRVEPDLSFARIVNQDRPLKTDDKVLEKLENLLSMGS
jgi:tetratricopeptide (TPR) repeat protein